MRSRRGQLQSAAHFFSEEVCLRIESYIGAKGVLEDELGGFKSQALQVPFVGSLESQP